MDNPGYNNDETNWVDERLARLSPPPGWRPDTDKAVEDILQRAKPASMRPAVRLSMAGATLAVIGVIVVLLPWKALWTPKATESPTATQAARLEQTTPQIPNAAQVTVPVPQPTTAPPKSDLQDLSGQEPRQTTPLTAPEAQPVSPQPRKKKEPRIIAALEPQQDTAPSIAQAQEPQAPGRVSEPIPTVKVQPQYTPEAKAARIQGTVILSATVQVDGSVKVEGIVQSLGFGLDEASTAALEQWKFIPGKKDGQPVAVTTNVQFHFGLK
jgi:TonB family protein